MVLGGTSTDRLMRGISGSSRRLYVVGADLGDNMKAFSVIVLLNKYSTSCTATWLATFVLSLAH
jgi:hypothetical protein